MKKLKGIVICLFICCFFEGRAQDKTVWINGMPDDPGYFPIAVWLQDPTDATAYKQGGINLYMGLWQGPTEDQLSALRAAGMPVMCSQNSTALNHLEDSIIVGWTQQDEPDNAQPDGSGGYDPCIAPEIIVGLYDYIRKNDSTRPVYLNLGQGVSYTDWVGRGACTGDTLSYPAYIEGCDIVSYDIYPVTSKYELIRNNLWYVPQGIDNLWRWSGGDKPVWCWIETTHINSENKPTPSQVKAEVWMALIHGADGFGYFCHEWVPEFNASALLDDPIIFPAVAKINAQIHQLAAVLNSPDLHGVVSVESGNAGIPVDLMVKHFRDTLFVFAVSMRDGTTTAAFTMKGIQEGEVTVIGEDRKLTFSGGIFEDLYEDYGVHLYKMPLPYTGVGKETASAFSIFPNPCSDFLTIHTDLPIQYLSLTDLTGKMIEIPAPPGKNQFDLSRIIPGTYILQVLTSEELHHHKILIHDAF
jgi:hypothetical protein